MRNNLAGVAVASRTVVPVRLGTYLHVTKSWSSTGLAVSHDDVPFFCRRPSLRELMFPADRRASNSSFSFSLRMAVYALFAQEAAGNVPSHCCMPFLITSVRVLPNFDAWCSCRTRGHRIADSQAAQTRLESEETTVSSDSALTRQRRQKLVPERLFLGSKGRLLCRNHPLKVAPFCWEAVDKSCTRCVGLTDLRRCTLKMFQPLLNQPLQIPSNKVWTANRPSQVALACRSYLHSKIDKLQDRQTAFQLWADTPASPQAMISLHWESSTIDEQREALQSQQQRHRQTTLAVVHPKL